MTSPLSIRDLRDDPGVAAAEEGLVILDGPNGIAVSMTPEAAAATGRSLLAAAEEAARQRDAPIDAH